MNRFKPMTVEQTKLLASILMSNNEYAEIAEKDYPFLSQIVKKRIEALNLPVRFTPAALVAVNAFCDRPGSAVVLLIDTLNKFCTEEMYQNWLAKTPIGEGLSPREVKVSDLCNVYPYGFYTEEALEDVIDNTMKAHRPETPEDFKAMREGAWNKKPKIAWAELY